jgi:hypothetical protein
MQPKELAVKKMAKPAHAKISFPVSHGGLVFLPESGRVINQSGSQTGFFMGTSVHGPLPPR